MSTSKIPWADTPFSLIPIPSPDEDLHKAHGSVFIAREMTCAHNGMLRVLNSIYQQCAHVSQPGDIADLLQYTQFWQNWLHEHHDGEEKIFFPKVEEVTGVKGLMDRNVEQHDAFMPGLNALGDFLKNTHVDNYDALKLRGIIDRFGAVLSQHLTEEISTLLALSKYDGPGLKQAWNEFDLEIRNHGDKSVLFPIVFGSSDKEFEGTGEWPEVPGFIRMIVHYWFERKHQGAWRFSPCTTWGVRRPLMFVGESKV